MDQWNKLDANQKGMRANWKWHRITRWKNKDNPVYLKQKIAANSLFCLLLFSYCRCRVIIRTTLSYTR